MDNRNLKKLQKRVFDYSFYKLFDHEAAQEITAQTMALFCLKCDYENEEKIKGWLINTAKNYIKKYYEKQSKENRKKVTFNEQLHYFLPEDIPIENEKTLREAFSEAMQKLQEKEIEFLFTYFRCDQKIKKLHETIGGSYDALRKRISRIKKKLKAETYRNLGFIGSKKIVTPELDNLIYQFLRRFKKNLEENTLNKMHYYFSEVDLINYNENIHIKKIVDYDIEFVDSKYKTWILYRDLQNEPSSFILEFYVDKKKHLRIVTPPTKHKKPVVLDMTSLEGKKIIDLMEKYPEDKTGRPNIPTEEIEKIIKEFEAQKK